jgi:hypothetical protein
MEMKVLCERLHPCEQQQYRPELSGQIRDKHSRSSETEYINCSLEIRGCLSSMASGPKTCTTTHTVIESTRSNTKARYSKLGGNVYSGKGYRMRHR